MSAVTLPDGTTLDIFGSGGGHEVATRLGVPLLGSIPLSPALREAGDAGIPLVIGAPGDTVSQRVIEIAHAIVTSGDSKVGIKLPMSPRQA
jgi:ATP-binding protein involved in chromosome partitioning